MLISNRISWVSMRVMNFSPPLTPSPALPPLSTSRLEQYGLPVHQCEVAECSKLPLPRAQYLFHLCTMFLTRVTRDERTEKNKMADLKFLIVRFNTFNGCMFDTEGEVFAEAV